MLHKDIVTRLIIKKQAKNVLIKQMTKKYLDIKLYNL